MFNHINFSSCSWFLRMQIFNQQRLSLDVCVCVFARNIYVRARNIVNAIPDNYYCKRIAARRALHSLQACKLCAFRCSFVLCVNIKKGGRWESVYKSLAFLLLRHFTPDGSINFHLGYSFFSFFHIIFYSIHIRRIFTCTQRNRYRCTPHVWSV